MQKLKRPKFKSEAEEAEWWYKHRHTVEAEIAAGLWKNEPRTPLQILAEHRKRLKNLPPQRNAGN